MVHLVIICMLAFSTLLEGTSATITPLTLEHAVSVEELDRGLMERSDLPEDHGMTFSYAKSRHASLWMMNCLIDLSAAFLDENKVIRELYDLKAYPQIKDPKFFITHSITASFNAKYALEMNKGWFKKHDITPGDVAVWNYPSSSGFIIHTKDLSAYAPTKKEPIVIPLSKAVPTAVWMPNQSKSLVVTFLDEEYRILKKERLKGGKGLPPWQIQVLYTVQPVGYIVLSYSRR